MIGSWISFRRQVWFDESFTAGWGRGRGFVLRIRLQPIFLCASTLGTTAVRGPVFAKQVPPALTAKRGERFTTIGQQLFGCRSSITTLTYETQWLGQSRWYVMMTVESFNGFNLNHTNPPLTSRLVHWFSSGAFGGTNYINTPVGAVSHVEEPTVDNVNEPATYFGTWAAGKRFGTAAWKSRITEYFQAVGDPLITR